MSMEELGRLYIKASEGVRAAEKRTAALLHDMASLRRTQVCADTEPPFPPDWDFPVHAKWDTTVPLEEPIRFFVNFIRKSTQLARLWTIFCHTRRLRDWFAITLTDLCEFHEIVDFFVSDKTIYIRSAPRPRDMLVPPSGMDKGQPTNF